MCGERKRAGRTQAQNERAQVSSNSSHGSKMSICLSMGNYSPRLNYVNAEFDAALQQQRGGQARHLVEKEAGGRRLLRELPAGRLRLLLADRQQRSRRAATRGRRGSWERCGALRDRPANRHGRRSPTRSNGWIKRPSASSAANSARVRIATPCPAIAALPSEACDPMLLPGRFGQFVGRDVGGGEPLPHHGSPGSRMGSARGRRAPSRRRCFRQAWD